MSTYFTIWHWAAVVILVMVFFLMVILTLKEKDQKTVISMILTSFFVLLIVGIFVIMAIDNYTKQATLYGVKNKRILRNESIVFTGYVKNNGIYKIGKVELIIKIVNKAHAKGNVKPGSFYQPNRFFDLTGLFVKGTKKEKVQKIEEVFTVATDLKPDASKFFRVQLPYPSHFKNVSYSTSITAR